MALPEGEVIGIVAFGLRFAATAALASRSRLSGPPRDQQAAGEHPARRIEMVWIIGGGILYLILVVTLGVMTIRKGHWIMFIIGFFLPFFWLIGALMPARGPAY
jgi:hypothetical protein